jgi:hypothetical protein
LNDRKAGEASAPRGKRKKAAPAPAARKKRSQRTGDIGRALRSVYDETLREDVPDDFHDLLGKLR